MRHNQWFKGLGCLFAFMSLAACSGEGAQESVSSSQDAIVNGDSLDRLARPYEEATVTIHFNSTLTGGCSATLLGNQGFARYALTARHCLDLPRDCTNGVPMTTARIGRDSQLIARGVTAFCHPQAFTPMPNTVDVALVQLDRNVPLSTKQYFTTLTPTELVGESARCYGGGSQVGTTVSTALFDVIPTDSAGSRDIHYMLINPNAAGQRLGNGDSGGICVRPTGTTSMTIYGLDKAGSTTSARQTAAVSFSDWVRTFVPR
jgi:hypothetical protein